MCGGGVGVRDHDVSDHKPLPTWHRKSINCGIIANIALDDLDRDLITYTGDHKVLGALLPLERDILVYMRKTVEVAFAT